MRSILFPLFFFLFTLPIPAGSTIDTSLLQQLLEADFADVEGGILLVRPEDGRILASVRIEEFYKSYPQGSLIKVFTALAYYRTRGNNFPRLNCPPSLPADKDGCWDRNGHGQIGIVRALAHSCNVYFSQLARETDPEAFANTLKRYQLIQNLAEVLSLPDDSQRKLMVGRTNEWRVEPARMLRAYCAFFNGGVLFDMQHHPAIISRPEPSTVLLPHEAYQMIRSGMGLSSAEGTSVEARKAAGVPVLGKTGTTLPWNRGRVDWKQTQGWWIGLHPVTNPEVAIMVFVRNGRGATDAAPIGGKALALYIRLKKG